MRFEELPDADAELRVLKEHAANALVGETGDLTQGLKELFSARTVLDLMNVVHTVAISDEILSAIQDLVRSTRPGDPHCPAHIASGLWYGAGPRAGISLVSVCRALALMEGKEHVHWQHVRRLAKPALRHRLRLPLAATRDRMNVDQAIDELLAYLETRHHNLARGLGG